MSKVRLGDVCTIQSGGTPSRSKKEYWNGSFPWVKISDFNSKYLYSTDEFISEEGLNNSSAKIFPENSILFTIFATLGEVTILKIPAATNQAIAGLTIKDDSELDIDYLYYFLLSLKTYVDSIGRGVAQNNINMSILKSIKIPMPSIETQRKNAYKLDEVSRLIDLCNNTLKKFDTLVKSRFVEMFGDIIHDDRIPKVLLAELVDISSSKRIYANEYTDKGIPFYRSKEIRELGSGLKPTTELFISGIRYKEIKDKYGVPKIGDILIAAIGATIGYSWIVDTDKPFYYKDGNLIILSLKDGVNSVFLNHTLGILIDDFKKRGVSGSAQLALTIERLEKMSVIRPSLDSQNRFADFVAQTDKSKLAVQKSLEKLETLKKSLMQEYFG